MAGCCLESCHIPSILGRFMLLIDDRENQKIINSLLMRMGDSSLDNASGQARVKRLVTADYAIGQWGVEAKEINDLYRSIMGFGRTRTIVDQLIDLQNNFEHPFLVVYGTKLKPYVRGYSSRQKTANEISRMQKTIERFKQTFYQRFPKIRYMELASMEEFINWLIINHTQMMLDGEGGINRLPEFVKKAATAPTYDNRVSMLVAIPGITPQIAIDLLQKFGSVPKILHSRRTQKDLMEIKGIGRDKAKKILALRESFTHKE